MKVMEYLMYFLIFNIVLLMFKALGIFSSLQYMEVEQGSWFVSSSGGLTSIIGLIGFGGGAMLATFTGAVITGWLTRADPFVYMAYGLFCGIILSTWVTLFSVIDDITRAVPETQGAITWVKYIILSVFALLFINALRQMSTGGDRGAN